VLTTDKRKNPTGLLPSDASKPVGYPHGSPLCKTFKLTLIACGNQTAVFIIAVAAVAGRDSTVNWTKRLDRTGKNRFSMEKFFNFEGFGAKKLICKFPAKGYNVKELKKLSDSGWTRKQTERGHRPTSRCAF